MPTALELKELDEFLLARAMEHDSPTLLFRLACEYLISVKVIRPGPVTLLERVAQARRQAQRETYDRLAHALTGQRCAGTGRAAGGGPRDRDDPVAVVDHGAVEASPAGIKAEVDEAGVPARAGRRTRWICRCCRRSGAGSWPRSGAG